MGNVPNRRMRDQRPPTGEEALAEITHGRLAPDGRVAVTPLVPPPAENLTAADAGFGVARARDETPTAALPSPTTRALGTVSSQTSRPTLSFEEIYSSPENQVFKVVFFPDRIFHAQYLNATRAANQYRYAISAARSILDISVLKAQVFMFGQKTANLLRIEYRASRLVEKSRESGRFMRERLIAWVRVTGQVIRKNENGDPVLDAAGAPIRDMVSVESPVKLQYCPWIDAYQVEIWSTLEPPQRTMRHHFQVTAQMGPASPITRLRSFTPLLNEIDQISTVELAMRENDVNEPYGLPINNPKWDNNNERSYQAPNSPVPNDHGANTIGVGNYLVSFQNGWFLKANDIPPVRYRNAMMDSNNPDFVPPSRFPQWESGDAWRGDVPAQAFTEANVIEMRWILQREFGGSVVFFHEVTIPPGTVEGTHKHVGSEELYYIVSGEGVAYMAEGDDPATAHFPKVQRQIYGLFEHTCVELPVGPGNVIFTKSGGIHGIRNTGNKPLKFVAFLYHSV